MSSKDDFDTFLRERRYLKGVSEATETWWQTFKWLKGTSLT